MFLRFEIGVEFSEKEFARLIQESENRGCDFDDAGKKELIARLLSDSITEMFNEVLGPMPESAKVTHHKVLPL